MKRIKNASETSLRRPEAPFQSVSVHYSPPPDGRYPPRLLAPRRSIWIAEGKKLRLYRDLSLQRTGSTVTLLPTKGREQKVLVNGQPLLGQHILHDGDFIQMRKETFIFQADPVADRKRRMLTGKEYKPYTDMTLAPSIWLRERIGFDGEGISLNGEFLRWDRFMAVEYGFRESLRGIDGSLTFCRQYTGQCVTFKHMSQQDYQDLNDWLALAVPFDLTIYSPRESSGGAIRDSFPDAYYAAAHEKNVQRAQASRHALSTSTESIPGFRAVIASRRVRIWGFSVILFLFVFALMIRNRRVR